MFDSQELRWIVLDIENETGAIYELMPFIEQGHRELLEMYEHMANDSICIKTLKYPTVQARGDNVVPKPLYTENHHVKGQCNWIMMNDSQWKTSNRIGITIP